LHTQSQAVHPPLRLPAGEAGIYQDGFVVVAYVIAIPIATGIK